MRCPSPKPHSRIGPSGHVTGVPPPNFEILATPLPDCFVGQLIDTESTSVK